MEEQKDTGIKWYKAKTSNIVAICSVMGVFLLVTALFIWEVPEKNQQLLTYVVGSVMTSLIGGVIMYLFNYNSKNKTE